MAKHIMGYLADLIARDFCYSHREDGPRCGRYWCIDY